MTLKDLLENGYGIDFSTLKFEMRTDLELDGYCTKEDILKSMTEDEFIVNGEFIEDYDIVFDSPHGFVELYPEDRPTPNEIVDGVVVGCLHILDDEEEFEFETPVQLSENRIAKKFWTDDGHEDVRVEIWQTHPTESWREDAFLSSMELDEAVKVAKAINARMEW